MWNNRSILFHQVCPQTLLRGLSAVRLAQVARVCFSPEYWEGSKSKKIGVWVFGRGESAEYQPDISRIADQNLCSCKKIKTNNPPKLKIRKTSVGNVCFLSVCFFLWWLSLFLCPFLMQHVRQTWQALSGLPGAIVMVPCRDVAAPRKMVLSLADLWRQSSSCGLFRSDSFASKIK